MSTISWTENGSPLSARWHSENATPAPNHVVVVDDRTTANAAYRLARAGTGLLWRGDFHNARQLMQAMDRRLRRSPRVEQAEPDAAAVFSRLRAERAERAELLGRLVVLLEADHSLRLRRAPDVRRACAHAYGAPGRMCVSLSELLGVLGSYQWHRNGVEIPALDARIHPDYGVFSPVRGEYVDLVARASFPSRDRPLIFDLGTGTGVLAAVLARRGARVVATDINGRAVACARANLRRLGLADRVRVVEADLWPSGGRADVIVCNPPWLPGQPTSALEFGIYDPGSAVLHRFLGGLADHLAPGGEGWLVLSDLAELLGLRTRADLLGRVAGAGLRVIARYDTAPRRRRPVDSADPTEPGDPLQEARSREVISLWRLAAA